MFSKIKKRYIKYIKKVFKKLQNIEILFKPKKYKFYKQKIKFLRFFIGKNSICIDFTKVEIIFS